MAIITAIISKLRLVFASYVISEKDWPLLFLNSSPFAMPFLYLGILVCVTVIAYFCWQSYRQEIHEEKLQDSVATNQNDFASYNLTWINKLLNWAYMSSSEHIPQAIERWVEDININLAKKKSPLKILIYGFREGSIPPWIREVTPLEKKEDGAEMSVLLESSDFGFMVSIQEEDQGKVIASTYSAIVTQFQCWYTGILLRCKGEVLTKLTVSDKNPKTFKMKMKCLSDQSVASTVPEVISDIIKCSILETPFYLNLSTWGPVRPAGVVEKGTAQRDDNGNNIEYTEKVEVHDTNGIAELNDQSPKRHNKDHQSTEVCSDSEEKRKSNTLPPETAQVIVNHLKSVNISHMLSGSLGSLVGIKRTPSGRGPPKPIRAREKLLVIKVEQANGLPLEGVLFCIASLDFPQQKSKTTAVKIASGWSWPDNELKFDLSARSSEVKFAVCKHVKKGHNNADSLVATGVLCLDGINVEQSSEQVLPLTTVDATPASLVIQLTFTENPVESSFAKTNLDFSGEYRSPRRSLDLSLIADQLPPMVDEKGDSKSKSTISTLSSLSSGNISSNGSQKDKSSPSTTVTTVTTRKLKTSSSAVSAQSIEVLNESQSQSALVNGSVAETAIQDLSKVAEITEQSPHMKKEIKKGKLEIIAVVKSDMNEQDSHLQDEKVLKKQEKIAGDEIYYSMCSLSAPNVTEINPIVTQDKVNKEKTEVQPGSSKPKKKRRTKRPKSLIAGVKDSDRHSSRNDVEKEWPKVRRSRSLILGKGKRSDYKTNSATDLQKAESNGDLYVEGYEKESCVTVPENELQKHSKKKKSKSVTKLFSKIGRLPSMKKKKRDHVADIVEENDLMGETSSSRQENTTPQPGQDDLSSEFSHGIPRPASSHMGSEVESNISDIASPSLSYTSSLVSPEDNKSSVKRSKSLRKRLFGGKRKATKN